MAVEPPFLWPAAVLPPAQILANPMPFSRSGGRTLGGVRRSTRTDRGYWSIGYRGIALNTPTKRRVWNQIRSHLCGMAGLIVVPVWSNDSTPWPAGTTLGYDTATQGDGTPFEDGSSYSQPGAVVEMVSTAAIGATVVTLRLGSGVDALGGVRFSYGNALYETGSVYEIDGDEWTVDLFPAVRATIPADAALDLAMPGCLCRLASDNAMDTSFSAGHFDRCDVSFLEAVDYWSDLAAP